MKSKLSARKITLYMLLLGVLAVLAWAYQPSLTNGNPPLLFRWEGAIPSKVNFRDAGQSINACASKQLLPEGVILRASSFFSGWSCDEVGDPSVIYSINFHEQENRRYYCRTHTGVMIGESFQTNEISDLEFIRTWDDQPEFVAAACQYLKKGIAHVEARERFLYHCDAGRDRTGALTALLAGWLLEENGPLDDQTIEAIECDYRKSASLKPYKYGRIKLMLTSLRDQHGGVRKFLKEKCD